MKHVSRSSHAHDAVRVGQLYTGRRQPIVLMTVRRLPWQEWECMLWMSGRQPWRRDVSSSELNVYYALTANVVAGDV